MGVRVGVAVAEGAGAQPAAAASGSSRQGGGGAGRPYSAAQASGVYTRRARTSAVSPNSSSAARQGRVST